MTLSVNNQQEMRLASVVAVSVQCTILGLPNIAVSVKYHLPFSLQLLP
jgi:hypothetical protein